MNVAQVARALNIDVRRVQQLVNEGLPREARGRYDGSKCIRWYIRYLQAVLTRRAIVTEPGDAAALRRVHLRKLRVVAELKQIELDRQRSHLVSIADAEKFRTSLVQEVAARILAIAPRLAPELLGETSRVMVQAKIDRALRDAFRQLALRATNR